MIVDARQRGWAVFTLAAFAASSVAYLTYSRVAPAGPRGGSGPGIAFGALALALMAFAGLLGARRALRTWRLGRASTWLKGHVWLSLLAVLFVLFHAGFRLGGGMTTALMALLAVVTVSGVVGLTLQNVLPRIMTERAPLETVYEQIPQVIEQLRAEADTRVSERLGPVEPAPGGETETAAGTPLLAMYRAEIRPFLDRKLDARSRLASRASADLAFAHVKTLVPEELKETADDLAAICEERRQLATQARLHLLLHAWVLVHAPLSYALLILSTAHAVIAIRY